VNLYSLLNKADYIEPKLEEVIFLRVLNAINSSFHQYTFLTVSVAVLFLVVGCLIVCFVIKPKVRRAMKLAKYRRRLREEINRNMD